MGSKRGWPQALKRRCEAVGWDVGIAQSGHYRAKTHEGHVFTFANTPSSVRSERHALAQAKRFGLDELEELHARADERERQHRIKVDRQNGVDWDAEEEMRQKEMQKIKAETEGDLGYVNGIAVAERAPAIAGHPRAPETKIPIKHGQELLLVDASVVYQCVYEVTYNDIKQDCGRFFETPSSLRSHIAWHARQRQPKVEIEDEKTIVVENEVPEVIEKQPGIIARIVNLADEFDELVDEVTELAESTRVKRDELRKLLAEVPLHVADGETREKARKYDEMRKLLD